MNKFTTWTKTHFDHIVVEPMLFIFFMGYAIFATTSFSVVYFKVCEQNFKNTSINCSEIDSYENNVVQEQIEADTAMWIFYINLASVVASIFGNLVLGAWGDNNGRKINCLIAMGGMALEMAVYVYSSMNLDSSLTFIPIVVFLTRCSGTFILFNSSCCAYIADNTISLETRTIRFVVAECIWSAGYSAGGFLASFLLKYINFAYTLMVAIGFILIAMIYCALFMEQIPPPKGHRDVDELPQSEDPSIDMVKSAQEPFDNTIAGVLRQCLHSIKDIWITFTRTRSGYNRLYLTLIVLSYFPFMTVDQGLDAVLGSYVFRKPLTFTPSLISAYWGVHAGLQILGSFLATMILKSWLKFTEPTIIAIALVSTIGQMITLGVAMTNSTVFLAGVVGCIYTVGFASTDSYSTYLVGSDEVGKVLAGLSVAVIISPLIGASLYLQIYRATVNFFAGFAFFFIAVLLLVSLALILVVYFHTKYVSVPHSKAQSSISKIAE